MHAKKSHASGYVIDTRISAEIFQNHVVIECVMQPLVETDSAKCAATRPESWLRKVGLPLHQPDWRKLAIRQPVRRRDACTCKDRAGNGISTIGGGDSKQCSGH